jgi:hypothetical protein
MRYLEVNDIEKVCLLTVALPIRSGICLGRTQYSKWHATLMKKSGLISNATGAQVRYATTARHQHLVSSTMGRCFRSGWRRVLIGWRDARDPLCMGVHWWEVSVEAGFLPSYFLLLHTSHTHTRGHSDICDCVHYWLWTGTN